MDSRELLEKVVSTTVIGDGGGLMNAKQANRFIDYVVDQSVLIQDSRVVRMVEPTQDINKVNIGSRIVRKATENVDDGNNADPTFTRISMTTVKLRLDWELSAESLEDNIEGRSLEDHVVSLMARQAANDMEDLAIHGDTSSSDSLLKSLDGWRKLARSGSGGTNAGRIVDVAGANLTRAVFDRVLRNLPNKFLQQRSRLKFYTSSSLVQDYLWSLTLATGATGSPSPGSVQGDAILNGLGGPTGGASSNVGVRPFGIPLWEVPLLEETESGSYSGASGNHGVLELTFPDNRIFGIQRNIQTFREFKPRKDAIEFTQYMRIATQIENGDAFVQAKNVAVRSL